MFTSNVRVQYELVISESNNKLKGYSLTVFNINNVENTGVKTMKVKAKKSKISIEDDDLVFNDYTQRSKRVVLYGTLSLGEEDSVFVLEGSFFTRSLDRSSYTGTIRLEKNKTFGEARMVPILRKMDLWAALSIPEIQSTPATASTVSLAANDDAVLKDSTVLKTEVAMMNNKKVNKTDVANLPNAKKEEAITVGTLPGGTTKPGEVSNTGTETAAVPKPINKSEVADLPGLKKETIVVGNLPGGTTKPGEVSNTGTEPAAVPKPIKKSDVADLPGGTTKPGEVSNTGTETAAVPKPIKKSDVADLPGLKKETIAVGSLPGGTTKPGVVSNTDTEVAAVPKPINKSDVADLPGLKKETIAVGTLPGGVAKPGVAPRAVAEDIASRKTEVIRNIYVQSDSLVLSLYDNGEIDGDTVSVVMNDRIIIARQGLGINAIKATVYVPRGQEDSVRLVMYAENLGRIPPNTGLLIVQDGDETHHIRFSGDYQKNSAVILRRKR